MEGTVSECYRVRYVWPHRSYPMAMADQWSWLSLQFYIQTVCVLFFLYLRFPTANLSKLLLIINRRKNHRCWSTRMSSGGGKRRTRVGKYEIGKTLGEGSFAKVKFARNLVTGDAVAIKILDRERILKHKMVEQVSNSISCIINLCLLLVIAFAYVRPVCNCQMKREISTMKLIKHPNVLNLYEVSLVYHCNFLLQSEDYLLCNQVLIQCYRLIWSINNALFCFWNIMESSKTSGFIDYSIFV